MNLEKMWQDAGWWFSTHQSTQRENHILGAYRSAIVEAGIVPQVKLIQPAIPFYLPIFSEGRHNEEVRTKPNQAVKKLLH